MGEDWGTGGWVAVATLALVVLVVLPMLFALRRVQARAEHALALARAESEVLRGRVAALEARAASRAAADDPEGSDAEHVITMLGSVQLPDDAADPAGSGTPAVPAPLFADLVLREGVVQAASLAAGVRRALAPEHRHRIRLAMRREVKRARKQRRLEVRQARRDLHQRQRTGIDLDGSAA